MTSRQQFFDKYYKSNIFNTNTPNELIPKIRIRTSQSSLARTKDDLFNIDKKPAKAISRTGLKRLDAYSKIYGSDIFCRTQLEVKKKKGVKKIRNSNNFSTCMEGMKNNEEYAQNLKKYAAQTRSKKKPFNPDKYLPYESAAGRYYIEMYQSNAENMIPERYFSAENRENKTIYEKKRRNLNKDTRILNDCGVDGKKKSGEHEGEQNTKKIFVKKKNNDWTEKNNLHYVNPETCDPNIAKINKQIYMKSSILKDNSCKDPKEEIEIINSRIEAEQLKKRRDEQCHFMKENQKRDLTHNDRNLWGSVHSKWTKSNVDWRSPSSELMFGSGMPKDQKKEYGVSGPTAFQRKMNQLSDTKNIDTINETRKNCTQKLSKPASPFTQEKIENQKIEQMINKYPNLKKDKQTKMKYDSNTLSFNGEVEWDKRAETLNRFYTNPNRVKSKPKEVTSKVGTNNQKENEIKSELDNFDYVLSYMTNSPFEKYEENDIKRIFGKKGIHIYNVQKDVLNKGSYNKIKFKVRKNEDEKNTTKQIEDLVKEMEKKNLKIKVNKKRKKDIKLHSKDFCSNPGEKLGILNENVKSNNNAKYTKMPKSMASKRSFSNKFGQIDYKYKKNDFFRNN